MIVLRRYIVLRRRRAVLQGKAGSNAYTKQELFLYPTPKPEVMAIETNCFTKTTGPKTNIIAH